MLGLFDTISTVSVVLFAVGIVLLMIELFSPGFGIFGGLGLVALVLCIVFQAKTLAQGMLLFLMIGVIVAIMVLVALRSFKKGRIYHSPLVLKDAEHKEQGFVASGDYAHLAGSRGVSVTPLRPAGIADFGGEKADVVTDGDFIARGRPIEVSRVVGQRIIVRETEASDEILPGM